MEEKSTKISIIFVLTRNMDKIFEKQWLMVKKWVVLFTSLMKLCSFIIWRILIDLHVIDTFDLQSVSYQ